MMQYINALLWAMINATVIYSCMWSLPKVVPIMSENIRLLCATILKISIISYTVYFSETPSISQIWLWQMKRFRIALQHSLLFITHLLSGQAVSRSHGRDCLCCFLLWMVCRRSQEDLWGCRSNYSWETRDHHQTTCRSGSYDNSSR